MCLLRFMLMLACFSGSREDRPTDALGAFYGSSFELFRPRARLLLGSILNLYGLIPVFRGFYYGNIYSM
jgi:hypothetical protein